MFRCIILLILVSCSDHGKIENWKDIKNRKTLKVLTTNSSSTYFQDREEKPKGFEYELTKSFAKKHNLEVEYIVKDSIKDVIWGLKHGEGDIAAAGLTITDKRLEYLSFSPSYFEVNQMVTCKSKFKIKKLKDLSKLTLVLTKNSSFAENLTILKKKHKTLTWNEIENATSEVLLQKVWKEDNLCTIVDAHILSLHRRYMPELKDIYKFKDVDQIAWAINNKNTKLLSKITKWFNQKETRNKISDLKRNYFEFIEFDPYNITTYIKRINSRLPKYKAIFKKAAKEFELPWELLAAIGYQESYWDPEARSPTGVRGLMMLTRTTAKEVGVKNRLNPEQSITGGAKYLKKLIKMLPDYLHDDDKIWFALASYNVGFYHLRDALALSILQNKNPTRWHSVQKVLPLLSHKKYYKRLPYGHARGLEPVIYVKRIKDFYDILKKRENQVAPINIYK